MTRKNNAVSAVKVLTVYIDLRLRNKIESSDR